MTDNVVTRPQREAARRKEIEALLPDEVRQKVSVVVRMNTLGLTATRLRVKLGEVPTPGGAASHSVA